MCVRRAAGSQTKKICHIVRVRPTCGVNMSTVHSQVKEEEEEEDDDDDDAPRGRSVLLN